MNKRFQCFKRNNEGNVTMIFGLAIIVFMGLVGFAVDISRALQAQSALQNTIDKAALSLAQDYSRNPDLRGPENQANRISYIQNWLDINKGVKKFSPTFSHVLGDNKEINITADLAVKTTLLAIMNKEHMNFTAHSQAVASAGKAEIALVLDTTGSMNNSGKMAALQQAATLFTTTLFDQTGSDDNLKIGVVPFSEQVNVGMQHAAAPWLKKPTDIFDDWTYQTFCNNVNRNNVCDDINDNCTDGDPETGCWNEARTWCQTGGPGASKCAELFEDSTSKWQGCVSPRKRTFSSVLDNIEADSPNATDEFMNNNTDLSDIKEKHKYPGKIGWCNVKPMLPLSEDKATVLAKIDQLSWGAGNTHIPIGLSWGWHLLSQQAPFVSGASSADKNWSKYIVLMTDGNNSAYSVLKHTHWNTPEKPFNKYYKKPNKTMALLCNNIKASGIKIFTIAFQITNNGIKNKLKACASSETYYQDAGGTVSLADAFKNISDTISNLRLSH